MTDTPNFIPSASVILLKTSTTGIKVLLLRKNKAITFGGSWVFPGGRIDDTDTSSTIREEHSQEMNAACRECQEETGLSLQRDKLVAVSEWFTPVTRPKRFRTLFFMYDANKLPNEVMIDHGEIIDSRWIDVSMAVSVHQSKQLVLAGPAFVTLSQLSRFLQAEEAIKHYHGKQIQIYSPRVHLVDGAVICLYQGDESFSQLSPHQPSTDLKITQRLESSLRQHRLYMHKNKPWQYVDSRQ